LVRATKAAAKSNQEKPITDRLIEKLLRHVGLACSIFSAAGTFFRGGPNAALTACLHGHRSRVTPLGSWTNRRPKKGEADKENPSKGAQRFDE
jgi:hypothetical protein